MRRSIPVFELYPLSWATLSQTEKENSKIEFSFSWQDFQSMRVLVNVVKQVQLMLKRITMVADHNNTKS